MEKCKHDGSMKCSYPMICCKCGEYVKQDFRLVGKIPAERYYRTFDHGERDRALGGSSCWCPQCSSEQNSERIVP